ncbi:hypothetical protein [Lacticaseibacillus paracasei]|uniref:hypothetical protein n=1 Tax=Lacticaseibacillus paracasei TaxID=1597 RepID=UPI000FF264C1|nr:hypothetical protein [Lacticaseibacillus paracasei]RND64335.1 hypothetical protein FAM18123_00442 [Lacticaseibacillus paracasei]
MNKYELFSSVVQALTSIVAVVLSTIALIRSSKSERDANKPYTVSFLKVVRSSQTTIIYLMIKNFGRTGATILSVKADPAIDSGQLKFENNPFELFSNQLIAPDQTYAAVISVKNSEIELKTRKFSLSITYLDEFGKKETKDFLLNADVATSFDHITPVPTKTDEVAKSIYITSAERLFNQF